MPCFSGETNRKWHSIKASNGYSVLKVFFAWIGYLWHLSEWVSEWVCGWVSEGMGGWVSVWLGEWVRGWVDEWVAGWVGEWGGGWVSEWEWVAGWVSEGWVDEWVGGWVSESEWLGEWVSECQGGWVSDWLGGWVSPSSMLILKSLSISSPSNDSVKIKKYKWPTRPSFFLKFGWESTN